LALMISFSRKTTTSLIFLLSAKSVTSYKTYWLISTDWTESSFIILRISAIYSYSNFEYLLFKFIILPKTTNFTLLSFYSFRRER
jgi:hypothetical protein